MQARGIKAAAGRPGSDFGGHAGQVMRGVLLGFGQRQAGNFTFEVRAEQRGLAHRLHAVAGTQLVEQRHQHDRDVAVATLEAFQVIGQLYRTAHQRRAGFIG